MDLATIFIYLSLALIGLSLLLMIGFGLRTLIGGQKNYSAIASFVLAGVLFFVLYMIADPTGYPQVPGQVLTKAEVAIVLTGVLMLGLGLLALVFSGIRGLLR